MYGPGEITHKRRRQTWAFILPPKEDLQTLLPFSYLWTMFTTETLGKELGKEQKTLCKRLLTLRWNITMTKDFLADTLLLLKSSSINKLGLSYRHIEHMETLPAPKNLGLGPDISQGPVVVIVITSFTIISDILYKPVSHFFCYSHKKFTTWSVTCINCQFCVTPVHFNHSTYSWEQIKFHSHDNASLSVQLLQKEIFETF